LGNEAISDSVAVKIPVETGIQGSDSIEVVSPVFAPSDRILNSGNYVIAVIQPWSGSSNTNNSPLRPAGAMFNPGFLLST